MLHNKLERKQFLLSPKNWTLTLKKEELGITVLKLFIPNMLVIYKIIFKVTYMNPDYTKGIHEDITYRIKVNNGISETVSMTYLVDLLGKL